MRVSSSSNNKLIKANEDEASASTPDKVRRESVADYFDYNSIDKTSQQDSARSKSVSKGHYNRTSGGKSRGISNVGAGLQHKLQKDGKEVVRLYNSTKMRQLQQLVSQLQAATSISSVILAVLKNIKDVVNCNGGAFFVFKKEILQEKDLQRVCLQKTIVEAKYIDVVCLTDIDM